ncbi:F-box protein [Criblamydia sequanensis]|uniref:F-box domain-containing protein n=1 Tax=Candidatus Criblamydia sequanensis CRIB-18 TaxID=1437425 RepID=A0A090D0C4_9BACT|nr:F-box protein [Criblamydia sequanensis]CDR34977.1 F-box domain-containing protein [Criblamydia sequanensis CRIB-18]
MQQVSSAKITPAFIPCLGPVPEGSTEKFVAIPKELRVLIFSQLNASSREVTASVCRSWRSEVIYLELTQFRNWVYTLAEKLGNPSLDELITELSGNPSSLKELTSLKDSLYSTLAKLPIVTLKCLLTILFVEGIFIDTQYLGSKVMSFFKDDPKTLSCFTEVILELVKMGYVEKGWEAVQDIPLNEESYRKFIEKFLKKGNAEKVGDIATLHYSDDKKIQLIDILLGTTKIASLYKRNLKEEDVEPLALRIAESLPKDSSLKWLKIIASHFEFKNRMEPLPQEEDPDEIESACILS